MKENQKETSQVGTKDDDFKLPENGLKWALIFR
jgi:hypothetical protein